jgi:hypothetical protein
MHSIYGPRSWWCYDAVINLTAVVIYIYATFVLTSLVFLNADRAMFFTIAVVFCLIPMRIIDQCLRRLHLMQWN